MKTKTTAILHLNPPQRHHASAATRDDSHPVCLEIVDYCCRIEKTRQTQIPLSDSRLPVFALLPHTQERFVFDEVVADPLLFQNLHDPKIEQEVSLLAPKEALDNIACEIVAGAHHGASKLVVSIGALGSGHGQLCFGATAGTEVPSVGILWSLLDALGPARDGFPRLGCFQVDGRQVRDLLSSGSGQIYTPKTKNGIVDVEQLEQSGIQFVTSSLQTRQRLAVGLHQRRRALARWHATKEVIDRSEKTDDPMLRNILNQVGLNNYLLALDCCATTVVVIQLGPERGESQIVLVDMPSYAQESQVAEYKPSPAMSEVQKQAAALKHLLRTEKRDHLLSRIVAGCAPALFESKSQAKDLFFFASVQVSDVDRLQSHSVMALAGQYDNFITQRFFQAYKAQERKTQITTGLDQMAGQSTSQQPQYSQVLQLNDLIKPVYSKRPEPYEIKKEPKPKQVIIGAEELLQGLSSPNVERHEAFFNQNLQASTKGQISAQPSDFEQASSNEIAAFKNELQSQQTKQEPPQTETSKPVQPQPDQDKLRMLLGQMKNFLDSIQD